MENNSITRDRVGVNDRTFKEYSCQICQNLLWKPNSCSSCHRILCEKCMQHWFENPLNRHTCPFCSEPSEYKPCAFLTQYILPYLRIRCRNAKLGCKEILPYKQLEHHETANCQYLSEQCMKCKQLILRSKLVEHQQRSEQCISCPIKCTVCKNSFEDINFQEHCTECYQQKIDQLNTNIYFDRNMERHIQDNERITPNSSLIYLEKSYDNIELVSENLSPSCLYFLKWINLAKQARERNCDYFSYLLMMLKFILLNWVKIPSVIFSNICFGVFIISLMILDIYIGFSKLIRTYKFLGAICVELIILILTYGKFMTIQSFSDQTIMFCFIIFTFLLGSLCKMPLEFFEIHPTSIYVAAGMICLGLFLFIMKLILLLIRLYYSFIPTHLAIGLLVYISSLLTLLVA